MHCDYIWSLTLCTQGHPWHSEQQSLHMDTWLKLSTEDKLFYPTCDVGASSSSSYCTMSDMHQRPATGADFTAGSNAMWRGCVVLELCWITANQTPVVPSLQHISWHSHTQSCRRQKSSSSSLLFMHHTHHTCFCPAPEKRKKLSQCQAPNLVLNGCSVIIYLYFSSGFGGVLNLSRLLAEKQITPCFFSALGSSWPHLSLQLPTHH